MMWWWLALIAVAAADPSSLTASQFFTEVDRVDRMVVLFHSPLCGACRYIKPQFRDAALALEPDPAIQFFTIDATEEIALALQFDVTRYPLILLIQRGNVYEWKPSGESSSLVDFATANPPSSSVQWNPHLGPFSRVGTCKYYLGSGVQALIAFYHNQTDSLSTEWKTLWILTTIVLFVGSLFALVFLFMPSETKARTD